MRLVEQDSKEQVMKSSRLFLYKQFSILLLSILWSIVVVFALLSCGGSGEASMHEDTDIPDQQVASDSSSAGRASEEKRTEAEESLSEIPGARASVFDRDDDYSHDSMGGAYAPAEDYDYNDREERPPSQPFASHGAIGISESGGSDSGWGSSGRGEPTPSPGRPRPTPQQSGLSAGYVDDNKQFSYFVDFLERYADRISFLPLNIQNRIIVIISDGQGKSIPNVAVEVRDSQNRLLCQGKSYANGNFLFFPSEYPQAGDSFTLKAVYNQQSKTIEFTRDGPRTIPVSFDIQRQSYHNTPLDMVFIMDTTGSMGEEIERLKDTIDIIHANITSFTSEPSVRFGMVLYKDIGPSEDYHTHIIPLTEDLGLFQNQLDQVYASGGGDGPEDLQAALELTLNELNWRDTGIRLGFIITDAPPHLDYGQEFDYVKAVHTAREKGVKLFSIGTGGLILMGEYIMRQIAQYTAAKYIFLHYGEAGESSGGRIGSVSHHTGDNYQVDRLEAILIRETKTELSHLTDQPVDDRDEYFLAQEVRDLDRDQIMDQLFAEGLSQLMDYSTWHVESGTTVTVLPLVAQEPPLEGDAEYLTEQLNLSVSKLDQLSLVDRENLQNILQEQNLQTTDFFDQSSVAEIGNLMGASLMIIGKVYEKRDGQLEIFLKLTRVETAEVLSITKLRVAENLRL